MILLVIVLFIFYLLTSLYIYKKSSLFFLAYFILFMYTIFTQLGYIFYPNEIMIVSHNQYYGTDIFIYYWIYIMLSFIAIFIFFVITYSPLYKLKFKIAIDSEYIKKYDILYIVILLVYEFFLIYNLIKNYNILSYYNQIILKSNKIWFYLYSFNGIIILSLYCKICISTNIIKKIFLLLIMILSAITFLVTSIRSGQRIEIALFIISYVTYLWHYSFDKIHKKHKIKYLCSIFMIIFLFIMLSQGIRLSRGYNNTPAAFFNIITNIDTYMSIIHPKHIIFQDYAVPSLTLVTSINYSIIIPEDVLKSNITCLVPFIKHYSLGEVLSRIIDPYGWAGYGYYILTEGYNIAGFLGFIYIAFIFVVGFRFLESFFANTNDKMFNAYMYAIIAFTSLSIVRGQSMFFLKAIYLYFLPAIILWNMLSGKRVYLVRLKTKRRLTFKF